MKKKWLFAIPLGICLICIIIGSFLDFQIANGIFAKDNGFGIAFAGFGEAPVYAGISMIGVLFILAGLRRYKDWRKEWWIKLGLMALGVVGILIPVYIQMEHIVSVNALNCPDKMWVMGLPISLVINGLGVLFGIWIYPKEDDGHLLRFLFSLVFIIGLAIIITQVIKKIMCRPRFRFLIGTYGENAESYYLAWWQNGKSMKDSLTEVASEEFKSFPSGHATLTAFIVPLLVYLPHISNKIKVREEILFAIGVVYTLIMCVSRMTVGAHYLTDVAFGFMITTLSFLIFDMGLKSFNKKYPILSNEIIEY